MNQHDFTTKLREGEEGESFLDQHFSSSFEIFTVGMDDQRRGIDRIFVANGREYKIEYKTDSRAKQTGNAFVETVSVDYQNKPGWAYYSEADWLIYYTTGVEVIYIIQMRRIKENLPKWESMFRTVPSYNNGYRTLGIPVPLDIFERIAERVDSV